MMEFNRLHRHSIRLSGHDYSAAATYFITICVQDGACLFGQIEHDRMVLNACGAIIAEEWSHSAGLRPRLLLDAFVTMPNHLHGLVTMEAIKPQPDKGARSAPLHRKADSLGSFIAGFKAATTRRLNELHGTMGITVWQRNYHECIVRNSRELRIKRQYIQDNPMNWQQDEENPDVKSASGQSRGALRAPS